MNSIRTFAALVCPALFALLAACAPTVVYVPVILPSPGPGTTPERNVQVVKIDQSAPRVPCKDVPGGGCQIEVRVTVENNQCSVDVVPANVTASNTQRQIRWVINAGNDAAKAVVFVPGQPIVFQDPSGFREDPVLADAKRVLVTATAPHKNVYYSISMQWVAGPKTYYCIVDPIINNDFESP